MGNYQAIKKLSPEIRIYFLGQMWEHFSFLNVTAIFINTNVNDVAPPWERRGGGGVA